MAEISIAVVAPMYNEALLLPHFLRHYSTFADRIILLDNESDDESAGIANDFPKAELRSFRTEGYDEAVILSLLASVKRELADHDWILFPDIDEFIVSNPPRAERELLENAEADIFVTTGYCMVERPGEAPLDLKLPISRQRRWCYWSRLYCKPIVMRACAEATFGPGKHAMIPGAGVKVEWNSPFTLFHADAIDFQLFRYRKNRRPLSQSNIDHGWATGHFCRPMADHLSIWHQELGRRLEPSPFQDWGECYA